MRDSASAPEIVPVDSTPQPYTEYFELEVVIDKSQKEVALGDARLEMGVIKREEAGLEHDSQADSRQQAPSTNREWYTNLYKTTVQIFTVRLITWVGFVIFAITLISILSKTAVTNEKARRPLTLNGTAEVNVTP